MDSLMLIFLSLLLILIYRYIYRKYSYWSDKGVPGPPGVFPFGDFHNRLFKNTLDFQLKPCQKYGRVYGTYFGMEPVLIVADVDLVKQILVKDFNVFTDRREYSLLSKYLEPNLFTAQGQAWRRIRSIVTPTFTAAKLRRMYPLLREAANKLKCYFQNVSQTPTNSFDPNQVFAGFSIDVIASTLFGIDTDSNGDRSKFNPFLHHNHIACSEYSSFRFFLILVLPKWFLKMINPLINVEHVFPQKTYDFFINAALTFIERGGKVDNMITLLKEANISNEELKSLNNNYGAETENSNKETVLGSKIALSKEEIVAQCLIFFAAGNDTSSAAMTSCLFHIATNPEIQERLHREITDKLSDVDPDDLETYYDKLCKLPYVNAIIKETLRMYPPGMQLHRTLTGDNYELGGVQLEKGSLVEIPIAAIHYDPEYYEEPFKFDPDRFMPENEHKLVRDAYLPFGNGPRNCIGMRFALLEMKLCLLTLVKHFQFEPNEKTPQNMVFLPTLVTMCPVPYQISVRARDTI